MNNKYAYVTVLSTDSYLDGVLVMFESLKNTKSLINNFVVIINENISSVTRNILKNFGYIMIEKKSIVVPESIKKKNNDDNFSHWNYTFDKFNIFDLDMYEKIVYLDADLYINNNIDILFSKPNMSGVIAGKSYSGNDNWKNINSGVMVIEPKIGIKEKLIDTFIEFSSKNDNIVGDQDIIEEYFKWNEHPELNLDEKYNMFYSYIDYYINNLGYIRDDINIVHFICSPKPWQMNENEIKDQQESNKNQAYFFNKYMNMLENIKNDNRYI